MALQDEQMRKIIDCIFVAHQDGGMDCEMCNRELDCLAERVAAGANLHDLWPEVEAHLACCSDCREEFQAMVCILQAEMNGKLELPSDPK
jgi:predicted anti-sigma-YlaC factor YlaD